MPALSAYFYSTLYTLLQGENLPLFFLEERKEKKEEKKTSRLPAVPRPQRTGPGMMTRARQLLSTRGRGMFPVQSILARTVHVCRNSADGGGDLQTGAYIGYICM